MPTHFLEHDEKVPGLDQTTILDFWRWAYSDVLSNGTRSVFAEFMVGKALGCLGQPRVEWDSVDLHYGEFGIEVKASAACQRWSQSKPSPISFGIRKAVFWNEATGKYEGEATRSAHCYQLERYKALCIGIAELCRALNTCNQHEALYAGEPVRNGAVE
jgi:hypothetical protein